MNGGKDRCKATLATPNDQRLSAALTNPAEGKASNVADKPRWTKPFLVKELTLAVQGVESLARAGMRKLWL